MGLALSFRRPVKGIGWIPVLHNGEIPRKKEGKCMYDRVSGVAVSATTSIDRSPDSGSPQGEIGMWKLAYRIAHFVSCLICWHFGAALYNLRRAVGSVRDWCDRHTYTPGMVDISGRPQSHGRIARILSLDCNLPRGAFVGQWAVVW